MGGMPSARGLEWHGDGHSRDRFDKGFDAIPKVPYCVECSKKYHLSTKKYDMGNEEKCGLCGENNLIVGEVFQDTADELKAGKVSKKTIPSDRRSLGPLIRIK